MQGLPLGMRPRGASWAWDDPAPHRTLGTHSQDIQTELIAPTQGPAFSHSQGQQGWGCTERTDLALSVRSMVVAELGPQPSGLPARAAPMLCSGLSQLGSVLEVPAVLSVRSSSVRGKTWMG